MQGQTEIKQLRSFGLMVGGIFTAIGAWPLVGAQPLRWWAIGLGGLLMVLGGTVPQVLALPYRGWMAVGHVLGWINTRIILGVVFYALLTPMGLIRRALGHDPMRMNGDSKQDTYRVLKSARPPSHLKHQF
jgi:Saxitoxin biosynthesis operon protein SxtJ